MCIRDRLNSYLSADGTSSGQKSIDSAAGAIGTNRWYHLTYARSGDTMRMFIDGILVGSVDVSGFTNYANTNDGFQVGSQKTSASNVMNGSISNARIVKGTALYTSNFTPSSAPLTNVTNTKLLCCQSNTSATEGAVKPGTITANGDAAATTFNPFNTDINTVRGQETGYPTWNPLLKSTSTLSNGNLTITTAASGYLLDIVNRFTPAGTGRWYWEFVTTARAGTDYTMVGMLPEDNIYEQSGGNIPQEVKGINVYIGNNGAVNAYAGAATAGSATAAFVLGDVLGWAFDAENGTVECYKNGVSQGTQFTNVRTDVGWAFCLTDYDHTNASTHEINFGQKPFKFSPPDGFQPLNAANIRPETVIARPDQYVDVRSGLSAQFTISDLNFETNLMIAKSSSNDEYWIWADSVRGFIGGLRSNDTNAQGSGLAIANVNSNGYQSDSNWFTNGRTYVTYSFKAGGSKNTFNVDDVGYASAAAAGLDGGNKTPTGASVGTKQGFSIIKYDGAGTSTSSTNTISHGLSQAPTFLIVKGLTGTNAADDWFVYHKDIGATNRIRLNLSNAADTQNWLGNTVPTSSLVTITQGWYSVNYNGHTHIMYAWHDVPGLQKFGMFMGNGNAAVSYTHLTLPTICSV